MTLSREFAGRTAALIALACVVIIGLSLTSLAIGFVYSGQREEADQSLRQLGHYRSEIDARGTIEKAYAELKVRVASLPGLVHAGAGAPAAAQLQSAIKDIVESQGGVLRSAQALPSTVSDGFELVSVSCDLTVPASKLRDLIYSVETHRPYLFISSVDITAPQNWDVKPGAEPVYELRWSLSAYRWMDER